MKILDSHTIKSFIIKTNFIDNNSSEMQNSELSTLLSLVNFLNEKSQEILNKEDDLNLENIKYSHYYWLCQYKNEYYKQYGKDEGIEQQAFKLLENMNIELPNGVNWSIIEQIENGSIRL